MVQRGEKSTYSHIIEMLHKTVLYTESSNFRKS